MPSKKLRPPCYGACGKLARPGHLFCTQRCAADYAEKLILGNEEVYCEYDGEWTYLEHPENSGCPGPHITMEEWVYANRKEKEKHG